MKKIYVVGGSPALITNIALSLGAGVVEPAKKKAKKTRFQDDDGLFQPLLVSPQAYIGREPEQWQGKGKRRKPKQR